MRAEGRGGGGQGTGPAGGLCQRPRPPGRPRAGGQEVTQSTPPRHLLIPATAAAVGSLGWTAGQGQGDQLHERGGQRGGQAQQEGTPTLPWTSSASHSSSAFTGPGRGLQATALLGSPLLQPTAPPRASVGCTLSCPRGLLPCSDLLTSHPRGPTSPPLQTVPRPPPCRPAHARAEG